MPNRPEIIITPTTHWDREWVQPQIQYQIRLVQLIDRLMGILEVDAAFECFMMDGQTAPLEDYLQIKPENRLRLTRLIQAGRIRVGPWYVLADQFLEDGESTIRNLIIGRRQSRELGAEPMPICYVPDSFGCIDSMPMFAAGFGLRHAMFGRGRPADLPTDKKCFRWAAPDGSTLLAANHGYGSGLFLSYPDIWTHLDKAPPAPDRAVTQVRDMLAGLLNSENAPAAHLSAGVDHMEARAGLRDVVDRLNREIPDATFRLTAPTAYFEAIERVAPDFKTYQGELRGPDVKIFNGCSSSHMRLKQANFRAQRGLTAYLEPLATMAATLGHDYPRGFLDTLWRLLLINHPHDSICGCSIDRVHDDMANRYARIDDATTLLIEHATRAIAGHITTGPTGAKGGSVILFNPLAHARGGPLHQWVRIPHRLPDGPLQLVDENGRTVPGTIRVVATKQMDLESLPMTTHQLGTVLSKDAAPERADDDVFTVIDVDIVAATVPGLGYRSFRVGPQSGKSRAAVRKTRRGMTNGLIDLAFNPDGTFDLTDLCSGRTYPALHHFEDTEDVGDAYGHRHYTTPDLRSTRSGKARIRCIERLPHRVTWRVILPWKLPEFSTVEGRATTLRDATLTSDVSLHKDGTRVEITTTFRNNCKDHRLRATFATTITATHSVAEGNYSCVRRPIPDPAGSMESYPQQGFVEISDEKGQGLSLLNRGLPEFEAVREGANILLHLTLLRCTGELGPPAGANHPTPGAQDQGDHVFEYAIRPLLSTEGIVDRVAEARDYTIPLLAEGSALHEGSLPACGRFVELSGEAVLGALKLAEASDDIVLRLWNPASIPAPVTLANRSSLQALALDESPLADAPLSVPPRGLATFRTDLRSS